MAKEKKVGVPAAVLPAAPVEPKTEKSEFPNSVKPTGNFEVHNFGGSIAVFNREGQRVTPVQKPESLSESKDSDGKPIPFRVQFAKFAARSNALTRQNKIVPPKKVNPLAVEAQKQLEDQSAMQDR